MDTTDVANNTDTNTPTKRTDTNTQNIDLHKKHADTKQTDTKYADAKQTDTKYAVTKHADTKHTDPHTKSSDPSSYMHGSKTSHDESQVKRRLLSHVKLSDISGFEQPLKVFGRKLLKIMFFLYKYFSDLFSITIFPLFFLSFL